VSDWTWEYVPDAARVVGGLTSEQIAEVEALAAREGRSPSCGLPSPTCPTSCTLNSSQARSTWTGQRADSQLHSYYRPAVLRSARPERIIVIRVIEVYTGCVGEVFRKTVVYGTGVYQAR